ncbi:MAG: uroporphyrinogen decarboxylase family protein [Oscillospiraceae bacterium]|nr:uroporphyrinogen decarboxylase family protein [Oscillospiraceae bacterium]
MNSSQWSLFKAVLSGENKRPPVGIIVDSPWIPGYCGMDFIDFYARPDEWFNAYLKIKSDFPDILFLPDWWLEYGMSAEPSGFGCRISFYGDNLPVVHHIINSTDDIDIIDTLTAPDPRKDGLMPILLNLQRYIKPRLEQIGEEINIVSARGPLTIASHLFALTEMLLCAKLEPEALHRLLKKTTRLCIDWLTAQLDNVRTASGILVLDDVTGFFGKDDYEEFAHPYLKEIFSAFPDCVHMLHNDADNDVCFPYVADLGVDVFNFTHGRNIGAVRKMVGDKLTLLGNVPPMALCDQNPNEVFNLAADVIATYKKANNDSLAGLILSLGGGAPMGATKENIEAIVRAAKEAQ